MKRLSIGLTNACLPKWPEQICSIEELLADIMPSADEEQARQLDELLWTHRPASFLPHGLHNDELSDTIAIGWGQEPEGHNDLLINLQLEIPGFFSRFRRVAEVVTQDPSSLDALRRSWRFYKERGYQLEKHDL